jgi:hypothetical protein
MIGFLILASNCSFAQYGPGGKGLTPLPDYSGTLAALNEQLVEARREAYWQSQVAAAQSAAQQAELQKIFSRDPWRRIDNATNYSGSSGWFEFQGSVQETLPDGVVFKGKWGPILTVFTQESDSKHLTTTQNSTSQNFRNQTTSYLNSQTFNSTMADSASHSAVTDTGYNRPIIYGDDIFFVANFPYPAAFQQGYEEMMARESGYFTYTNAARRVVTLHKLDYGTPCVKMWSQEELAAMKQRADAPKKAALKANQQEADKGDAYGLLRMGERYRDGDGVEKDLAKARDYLQKAADAGSSTAKEELTHLPAN